MSEVAWVFGSVFDEVRSRGVAPEKLIEGLDLQVDQLHRRHPRISWATFIELARRTEEVLGDAGLGDLAARSALRSVPQLLRRALHKIHDVRPLYLIGARWWGPWIFRSTRATCEELADGRLRQVIEILPGYEPSPEFFRGVQALLRVMPRLFDLPEAVVELRHDGRRGEFIISPPPCRRGRKRPHKTSLADVPEELFELGFQQEQLRESERRAQASAALLAAKERRLDTLGSLQRLLSEARGLRDLANSLVILLEEDFLAAGVRLLLRPGFTTTEPAAPQAEVGRVQGLSALRIPLVAADGEIGSLEMWSHSAEGFLLEERDHLADLAPWIALALVNAHADDTVQERASTDLRAGPPLVESWSSETHVEPATVLERINELGPELAAQLDGGPILLVDGDETRRGLIEVFFEEAGFEVAWAGGDPATIPAELTAASLLIADWSRSQDAEFMARVTRFRPSLRGLLLLPLEQL